MKKWLAEKRFDSNTKIIDRINAYIFLRFREIALYVQNKNSKNLKYRGIKCIEIKKN